MTVIENESFRAAIRLRGAELASLIHKPTGREMIWQADAEIWSGSAPILFPIVGKLKDGKIRIEGEPFELPKHGLVRTRNAEQIGHEQEQAVFQFRADRETKRMYPFEFVLRITFRLTDTGLDVDYTVANPGTRTLPFTIGSHPAFALDLEQHALSDYSVEFEEPETLDLYGLKDGHLVRQQTGYLQNERCIPLSETLFSRDALIFREIRSRRLYLKPAGIEVDIRNHPHLGLWSKPGASFICIEPWHSFDDAADADGRIETKPGILRLPAGETFNTGYAVRAHF